MPEPTLHLGLGSAAPWAVAEAADSIARTIAHGAVAYVEAGHPSRCSLRYERLHAALAERGIERDHPLIRWEVP